MHKNSTTIKTIDLLNKKLGVDLFKSHATSGQLIILNQFDDAQISKLFINDLVTSNNYMTERLKRFSAEILKDAQISFIEVTKNYIHLNLEA